jgi:lipopolysaccharide transport system permease protein
VTGQDVRTAVPVGGAPAAPAAGAAGDGLRYSGPSPRWRLLNAGELWRHRALFRMLAARDLKVRYRQTLLGFAWVVLQPVALGVIFVAFFTLLGQKPAPGDVPYVLVVFSGLLLWQLFASTFAQASASLVGNQHLIGKVYFPRLILPLATAVPNLVDFAVSLFIPAGLMAYFGIAPSWVVVFAPAFVLLALAAAVAAGMWLSALNVMYRDAGHIVPLVVQLGFFLSPVMFATRTLIPERWQPLLALNPLVGAIEGFRWALFRRTAAPVEEVLIGAAVTAAVFVTGLIYFRRVEGVLADRI